MKNCLPEPSGRAKRYNLYMNDEELKGLHEDLESDRTERKASISDKDRICQAICAFANDLPNHRSAGVLFVGVNDDGSCAGLSIDDKLLQGLSAIRSDGNILPLPMLTVQKRIINGCEMAVVIVEPADAPPVRYKGRVWIRVGPRRGIASAEEERRLSEKRRSKDLPFDVTAMSSSTLDDLDLDVFNKLYLPNSVSADILDQNMRSTELQLSSLRFTNTEGTPTVLGILVAGKDPTRLVPGAYIQFLRIDGTELTDPIKDQKEIDGPLPDLLRMVDETFHAHVSIATDVKSASTETRTPDFPIVALQQLSRNAVMHRAYDATNAPVRITWFNDRIEIQNPGGPFGLVNRENFGIPGVTDYRNPHLAEAMKNLGYVQRFGIGIQLARQELRNNGNPEPTFRVEDTHVLVIIERKK